MNINIIENNKKLNFNNEDVNLNIQSNENISIDFNITGNVNMFLYSKMIMNNITINICLNEYSKLNIFNFIKSNIGNYIINVIFLGKHIDINYNCSIVGNITGKFLINHDFDETNSNIYIRGVNNQNDIKLSIIEKVEENINNCNISESSKIINILDSKSYIEPILLIKSNEVIASHSSIIKNIDKNYIEYFKSRGINEKVSIELIKEGFLLENFDEDQKKYIKEKNYEC